MFIIYEEIRNEIVNVEKILKEMHGHSNYFLLAIIIFIIFNGCNRDSIVQENISTTGYQIQGKVIDRYRNPVAGAEIKLFYDYGYLNSDQPPSKDCYIDNDTTIVTVVVYDRNDNPIRILLQRKQPIGNLKIEWDQRDTLGTTVPSGLYWIRYYVGTNMKHEYGEVVEGGRVAMTDALGQFTVLDFNLPIGYQPVPGYSLDGQTFYGNYEILSTVFLKIISGQYEFEQYVGLVHGQVVTKDFIIQ
jgi:hypothetical protein